MKWFYFDLPYEHNITSFFKNLLDYDCPIWLDSCAHATAGRYDILSAAPAKIFEINHRGQILVDKKNHLDLNDNFTDILKNNIPQISAKIGDFTFSGALGYFSYEFGVKQHNLKCENKAVHEMPQAWFGIYHWSIIIDHHLKVATLVYRNIDNLVLSVDQIKNFWIDAKKAYTL